MKKQGMLYTILFSFVLAFFFVFFLSLANNSTQPLVKANQVLAAKRSVLRAMGIPFTDQSEINSVYDSRVSEAQKGDLKLYTAAKDGETIYAKAFSGNGLWGTITGIIAVNADASRIVGIDILSHNETPGLGGRIDEQWFKDQFRNEAVKNHAIAVNIKGSGKGDGDPENGKVDAITGATRTSQFMEAIVNKELDTLAKALGGVQR